MWHQTRGRRRRQLECGTAWVNTHLALAPHQPFGGFKRSGLGVENGPWGLAEFSELQVVHRKKGRTRLPQPSRSFWSIMRASLARDPTSDSGVAR
jgi:hypothetical protein